MWDGWRWKVGYALVSITDHVVVNQDPASPDSSVDNQRGAPTHAVVFGLGHSWRNLEADLAGRWQSSFDDIRIGNDGTTLARYHISDYLTVDGRVGYTLTRGLTLAVSGQQINQARLLQTSGPPVERRFLGSLTARF